MAQSATSGGDNITFKYQSTLNEHKKKPVVDRKTYLLLDVFLSKWHINQRNPMLPQTDSSAPWQQREWYFQANLNEVHDLLKVLKHSMYESGHGFVLIKLIGDMLAVSPEDRPLVEEVVGRLCSGSYIGECCWSASQTSQYSELPRLKLPCSNVWLLIDALRYCKQ